MLTLDDIIFALIYCMICQVELQLPQPDYLTPLAEYLQQKVFPNKEPEKQPDAQKPADTKSQKPQAKD